MTAVLLVLQWGTQNSMTNQVLRLKSLSLTAQEARTWNIRKLEFDEMWARWNTSFYKVCWYPKKCVWWYPNSKNTIFDEVQFDQNNPTLLTISVLAEQWSSSNFTDIRTIWQDVLMMMAHFNKKKKSSRSHTVTQT